MANCKDGVVSFANRPAFAPDVPLAERVTPVVLDTVCSGSRVFYNTEVVPHSVCDHDQKSLVLRQSPLELQAVILQGASMDLKGKPSQGLTGGYTDCRYMQSLASIICLFFCK